MKTFKLCALWDNWSPRVANRIIIDLLTLKQFFQTRKIELLVCAGPELKPALDALGLTYCPEFSNCNLCRIYIQEGREVPDKILNAVPQDCEHDIYYLHPQDKTPPRLVVDDPEPYGRFPLEPQGRSIPPTMQPRYYRSKTKTEPWLAPFI